MAPPKKTIMGEKEWLQQRREVITATESAALLGLDPWRSPAKVMAEKQASTFTGNAYTFIGQLLEPIVVQCVNHKLGTMYGLFQEGAGKVFFTHPTLRLGATPDAGDDRGWFLECKTTKPSNYLKYSIEPPAQYVMQLITQLLCAEKDEGHLAIMSTDLTQTSPELHLPITIYKVTRGQRICELLEQELNRFWEAQDTKQTFRVNSAVKSEAIQLIQGAYERVL